MRWKLAQWFEVNWWSNYLKDKAPEEYRAWKCTYWKNFLASIELSLPPDQRILDVGCGPAGIFSILTNQQVTAIDPLLSSYDRMLPHFSKSDFPGVLFQSQDIETYKTSELFDHVFCINVINHVKDIENAFQALANALKPNGTLVLSIDCHNFWLPKFLFRLIPLDILHPHQFGLNEYKRMAELQSIQIDRTILIRSGFIFNYYAIVGQKT